MLVGCFLCVDFIAGVVVGLGFVLLLQLIVLCSLRIGYRYVITFGGLFVLLYYCVVMMRC